MIIELDEEEVRLLKEFHARSINARNQKLIHVMHFFDWEEGQPHKLLDSLAAKLNA